ncbi:MAG: hypothetical protein RL068_1053, partial [Actinomycetota bacterium]
FREGQRSGCLLNRLASSNPGYHQNLIYFDPSKLAKRPLLGQDNLIDRWRRLTPFRGPTSQSRFAVKQPDCIAQVDQFMKFG